MHTILVLCGFAALGMFFDSPSPPKIDPPPPPRQPQPDLADLARKRKDLQKRRRGVGSLRIESSTATGSSPGTGVSIPQNNA